MGVYGKQLQRVDGFVSGDGVKDTSVYLNNNTLFVDVLGDADQGSSPAFVVRGLDAFTNAPTELFRVNKDGSITVSLSLQAATVGDLSGSYQSVGSVSRFLTGLPDLTGSYVAIGSVGNYLTNVPGLVASYVSTASVGNYLTAIPDLTASYISTATLSSFERAANRNAVNGYAGLNANAQVQASMLGTGVADSSKFLRGDQSWVAAPGLSTGNAGQQFYSTGAALVLAGAQFSATAYGVVGDNLTTSAAANSTALAACIAAALAAGDGSVVLFDWTGTAYVNGGILIENRLIYRGNGFAVLKLNSGRAAGTHVMQTHNFASQTQTIPVAGHSQGEYEFTLDGLIIDGNKANNATGGHCVAIVGFGYRIENCIFQNGKSAGLWREYNSTQDAPTTDSGRQRASRIESVWLINNDCLAVAAANTRLSDGKAALTCGQFSTWGPGDSSIGYMECYRTDAVTGTGYQQLGIDFAAGTFHDFASVVDQLVIWGNHSVGSNLDSSWEVQYLHLEGATTCYQLQSGAQENKIHGGDIFNIQSGGTLINVIGSTAHFCYWQFGSSQLQHAGTMLAVSSTSAFLEGEVHMAMQLPHAVANTLTSGAGGAPVAARIFDMMVDNFGGATVTPGFCTAIPAGGTIFRYAHSKQPAVLGRATLLAPMFSGAVAALVGSATMTAAQLAGGFVEGTPVSAVTYITDTGTNLSSQWQGEQVGDWFPVWVANRSGGANTITLAAGAGVTLLGNAAVAQSKSAMLLFRNTGTNLWTCYSNVSA